MDPAVEKLIQERVPSVSDIWRLPKEKASSLPKHNAVSLPDHKLSYAYLASYLFFSILFFWYTIDK